MPTILQVEVTADTLNVRETASTSAAVIDVLARGKRLTVGALVENDCKDCKNWYPIYPHGWVCADFVEVK
jgi:uncharacterized protein YgiM (DUF1202 family)